MLQKISNDAETIADFLEEVGELQIDNIAIVVNHGKDFMAFSFSYEPEFLDIGSGLLKRFANGDFTHMSEH